MTQKQLLESVLKELSCIKKDLPNNDLKLMQKDVEDMKLNISDLKYTLLNPDNGVIVNTNKNTDFRVGMQSNEKDFQNKLSELKDLRRWKESVSKALWIIFASLAGLIVRALAQIVDKS